MNVKEITITGRIPSKKNSRNLFVSKGVKPRIMNLPSNKYAEWHAQAEEQVQKQFFCVGTTDDIQIDFYMPDKRRCDLTNKAESVMDLLVDTGVLHDDSWQCTGALYLKPCGVDKKNPRVTVWLRNY